MTDEERASWEFKRGNEVFGAKVEALIKPLAVKGFSCDLLIKIRDTNIAVLPQPLYKGQGWKARFDSRTVPTTGKD